MKKGLSKCQYCSRPSLPIYSYCVQNLAIAYLNINILPGRIVGEGMKEERISNGGENKEGRVEIKCAQNFGGKG